LVKKEQNQNQQQQQQQGQEQKEQTNYQQNKHIVVDASNCISGRLCSKVSKLLLQGNRVSVVNAEKVMVSGNKYEVIESYKKRLEVSSVTNPIPVVYNLLKG
jgi:large subunit ribosomal protein L13